MSWTEPKVDWTAGEYSNPEDFERQRDNINYLATEILPSLYYFPDNVEISVGNAPTVSRYNALEGNLAGIEACGVPLPTEWGEAKTWSTGGRPNYTDANRWEKNALLLNVQTKRTIRSFKPCGTFAAGQSSFLPRKVI